MFPLLVFVEVSFGWEALCALLTQERLAHGPVSARHLEKEETIL